MSQTRRIADHIATVARIRQQRRDAEPAARKAYAEARQAGHTIRTAREAYEHVMEQASQ